MSRSRKRRELAVPPQFRGFVSRVNNRSFDGSSAVPYPSGDPTAVPASSARLFDGAAGCVSSKGPFTAYLTAHGFLKQMGLHRPIPYCGNGYHQHGGSLTHGMPSPLYHADRH